MSTEKIERRNKILFWFAMITNIIFLLGLVVTVGEMKASVSRVETLEEFRVSTTSTLAVACRNIEYLTQNVNYLIERDRANRQGMITNIQPPRYDSVVIRKWTDFKTHKE